MPQDTIAPEGIIHDMRNLMTVICINSTMLSQQLGSKQSPLAAQILEAAECLTSLLENLAPRTMEAHTDLPTCDLESTLRQGAMFLRKSHASVEFILPEDSMKFELRIDRDELLRCLMNLMINAAEAAMANTHSPPTVEISVKHFRHQLSIHVIDSGNGFPCEPRKAFEPYVSGHVNRSTHRGLGLHVVKTIVESNGGSLRVGRTSSRTDVSVEFPSEILA